jgi:hypothetical protein
MNAQLSQALQALDAALGGLEQVSLTYIGQTQDSLVIMDKEVQDLRNEYNVLKEASSRVGYRLLSTLNKIEHSFGGMADAA